MKRASQVPVDPAPDFAYLRHCDLREIDNTDPDDPRRFRYLERLEGVIGLVRAMGAGGRVLEVGSAQANLSLLLAEAGYRSVALDLREDFLRYARSKWERGDFSCVTANALTLPFRGMVFDAVVVGELVEHVADPDLLLQEAVRVLKPGGLLIATTPNRLCLGNPDQPYHIFQENRHAGGRREWGPGGDDHLFALTMAQLVSLLPREVRPIYQAYTACRLINSRTHPILRRLCGEVPGWLRRGMAALPLAGSRLSEGLTIAALRWDPGQTPPQGRESSQGRTVSIVGNFLSLLSGWLVRGILGVLISVLPARYLGPTEMGRYAFLLWLVGLVTVALNAGIPTTATRYTAEATGKGQTWIAGALLRVILRRQLVFSAVVWGALSLASWLPGMPVSWRVPLVLAAANIPGLVLYGPLDAFLSGLQAFRIQAVLSVCQLLLQAVLLAAAVLTDTGLSGLILAHVLTNAATLAAVSLLVRRLGRDRGAFPLSLDLPADIRLEAFRYARALMVLVVLDAIVWERSEVAFLQALATPAEVAFYTVAFGLAFQVSRIPYHASVVLFPAFVERVGAGRQEQLGALHLTAMRYLVLVGAPLFIGVAAIAPELISLLYTEEYLPASRALRILTVGNLLASLAGASPPVLHAVKAQRQLVRQAWLAAAINVALALLLIPLGGATGAAAATVIAQGTGSLLAITAAVRLTGRPVALGPLARILGAAIAMAVPVHVTLQWFSGLPGLATAIFVGIVTYPLALRTLGALSVEDAERFQALCRQGPGWVQTTSARLVGFLCRT